MSAFVLCLRSCLHLTYYVGLYWFVSFNTCNTFYCRFPSVYAYQDERETLAPLATCRSLASRLTKAVWRPSCSKLPRSQSRQSWDQKTLQPSQMLPPHTTGLPGNECNHPSSRCVSCVCVCMRVFVCVCLCAWLVEVRQNCFSLSKHRVQLCSCQDWWV